VREAWNRTWSDLYLITIGLGTFFADAVRGQADMAQVAGPVGMVGMVGDAASLGITWLLIFTAFISLNLAVINLLPIPALDGGRLVFVCIEAITRKPIKPAFAVAVNQIGFMFLLALMAFVTISDVIKLF
jgi:regulator of sigma E protease